MRVAVMGCGSLGTILGAYLTKGGYDVTMVDAYKEHVDALNKDGAHIVGTVDFVQPVKACTPEEMEGIYDLIIYMAKQTFNATAIPQLAAHIDENSTVCVCQNGIPEYAVADVIGPERVVGAPVAWGATFKGPGCSALTTSGNANVFTAGALTGPINDRVLLVKKVLEAFCPVHTTDNLAGVRWTKLIVNATYSAIGTCFGYTFGQISDSEDCVKLALRIGKEVIDVCAEKGITLEEYEGVNFYAAHKRGNAKTNSDSMAVIRSYWYGHETGEASMLQDLKRGKKCEINEINGLVCKFGREVGIPTPVNDMCVEVITKIQNGELTYTPDNMKYFEKFLTNVKSLADEK